MDKTITIELENGTAYISEDGSSGAEYKGIKTPKDLLAAFDSYLKYQTNWETE